MWLEQMRWLELVFVTIIGSLKRFRTLVGSFGFSDDFQPINKFTKVFRKTLMVIIETKIKQLHRRKLRLVEHFVAIAVATGVVVVAAAIVFNDLSERCVGRMSHMFALISYLFSIKFTGRFVRRFNHLQKWLCNVDAVVYKYRLSLKAKNKKLKNYRSSKRAECRLFLFAHSLPSLFGNSVLILPVNSSLTTTTMGFNQMLKYGK